ncbi:MAG: hypothetical protein ACI3WT_03765 [Phascolarctobacterium sp.]
MNKYMLDVNDVSALLCIRTSKAYGVIRQLNSKLAQKGYMTVRGKVPRKYLYSAFGLTDEQLGGN